MAAFIVDTLIEPLPVVFHYSNIVHFKTVRTPHTKLKNGTPHNLGAVEWPNYEFFYQERNHVD
jgi:hypothetical protein